MKRHFQETCCNRSQDLLKKTHEDVLLESGTSKEVQLEALGYRKQGKNAAPFLPTRASIPHKRSMPYQLDHCAKKRIVVHNTLPNGKFLNVGQPSAGLVSSLELLASGSQTCTIYHENSGVKDAHLTQVIDVDIEELITDIAGRVRDLTQGTQHVHRISSLTQPLYMRLNAGDCQWRTASMSNQI